MLLHENELLLSFLPAVWNYYLLVIWNIAFPLECVFKDVFTKLSNIFIMYIVIFMHAYAFVDVDVHLKKVCLGLVDPIFLAHKLTNETRINCMPRPTYRGVFCFLDDYYSS